MHCPSCQSKRFVKNGLNALKKQIYRCKDCGRQFVLHPAKVPVSDEKKKLIDRLLLERLPLAGIARAVSVSESWLQKYVNDKYAHISQVIEVKKSILGASSSNATSCGLLSGNTRLNDHQLEAGGFAPGAED